VILDKRLPSQSTMPSFAAGHTMRWSAFTMPLAT